MLIMKSIIELGALVCFLYKNRFDPPKDVQILEYLSNEGYIKDGEITPKGEERILTLVEEIYCDHKAP